MFLGFFNFFLFSMCTAKTACCVRFEYEMEIVFTGKWSDKNVFYRRGKKKKGKQNNPKKS